MLKKRASSVPLGHEPPYRVPLIEDCEKQMRQKTFPHVLTRNPEWSERGETMGHRREKNIGNSDAFVTTTGIKAQVVKAVLFSLSTSDKPHK
jgi:hypothetical protein